MNVLAIQVDARAETAAAQAEADDRWLRERAGIDPEERRASWRRWLRKELEKALQWPSNPAARARLLGQCAAEMTVMARQLRGRGWLLDGAALAVHVRACLAPIGEAQRDGKVRDFYPYFCASVSRYVGANAEEIQAHARRTGADEAAQSMAAALSALGLSRSAAAQGPSMVELLAEHETAKQTAIIEARAQLPLAGISS